MFAKPAPISAQYTPEWLKAEVTVTPEFPQGDKTPDSNPPLITKLLIVRVISPPLFEYKQKNGLSYKLVSNYVRSNLGVLPLAFTMLSSAVSEMFGNIYSKKRHFTKGSAPRKPGLRSKIYDVDVVIRARCARSRRGATECNGYLNVIYRRCGRRSINEGIGKRVNISDSGYEHSDR